MTLGGFTGSMCGFPLKNKRPRASTPNFHRALRPSDVVGLWGWLSVDHFWGKVKACPRDRQRTCRNGFPQPKKKRQGTKKQKRSLTILAGCEKKMPILSWKGLFKNGVHIHIMGGSFKCISIFHKGQDSIPYIQNSTNRGVKNEHWLWLCHPVVFNHAIGQWFPACIFTLWWWLREKHAFSCFGILECLKHKRKNYSCKKHKPDTLHLIFLFLPGFNTTGHVNITPGHQRITWTSPNRHLFNSFWIPQKYIIHVKSLQSSGSFPHVMVHPVHTHGGSTCLPKKGPCLPQWVVWLHWNPTTVSLRDQPWKRLVTGWHILLGKLP